MRPPDLPGGNLLVVDHSNEPISFNEAAGFTRRKPVDRRRDRQSASRASMRPPDLPGGNKSFMSLFANVASASMRPPDLPGGNAGGAAGPAAGAAGFNEAAGFTRRKQKAGVSAGPTSG